MLQRHFEDKWLPHEIESARRTFPRPTATPSQTRLQAVLATHRARPDVPVFLDARLTALILEARKTLPPPMGDYFGDSESYNQE